MFRHRESHELDGAVVIGSGNATWARCRPVAFALLLVLFTGGYFYLARHLVNHTNGDRNRSDQQNNIALARLAAADREPDFAGAGSQAIWDWFPHRTDGVVNPLWPWIAARANPDELTDEEFFVRGKWLNVGLTVGFLLLGGAVAASGFSLPATINLLLLAGFGAFLPRAVWFQPEPVYFILFALAWVACLAALMKNSIWRYALVGFLCGLAYLAKASALPLLAAFLGVSTLRCLWAGARAMVRRRHGDRDARWCPQAHLVGAVLCLLAFGMTAGPRLNYAEQRFGAAFHSYPSYWMWLDRFEPDAIDFMIEFNGRDELLAMSDAERPSLGNFLDRHGASGLSDRLADGARDTAKDFLFPKRAKVREGGPDPWRVLLPDRGRYLIALLAMLAALWAWSLFARPKPEGLPQRHQPEAATLVLFVVGTALLYLALYGFYRPIGKGDRFMLSLYAPLVVSLIWAMESVRERLLVRRTARWPRLAYYGAHLVLTLFVLLRFAQLASHPEFYTK